MLGCVLALVHPAFAEPLAGSEPTQEAVSAAVLVNQRALSADQVAQIEQAYGVKIPPGGYWYDPVSGLWGNWGAPPSGQILPGFDLGPLPSGASGGASAVLINGRALHPLEVEWLVALFGAAQPGRYWLDAFGNLGIEGQPLPLVNLLAASSAARGGGFHHSSATGTTISSSGGSGYIMFDDGSGVSW